MATNGTSTQHQKPKPVGDLPPAPASKPAAPSGATNGTVNGTGSGKGKKEAAALDPVSMYESVKNRIAALEEEEVHDEEEARRVVEEARQSVKGLTESAIHAKYVDMYQDMKRSERDHSKEKQKLTKEKDASKSQLTKANQAKTKIENLGRELQKDNKRLRDDNLRKDKIIGDKIAEIEDLQLELDRRPPRPRRAGSGTIPGTSTPDKEESDHVESPDIVVKVICKHRAELYFKISRKTKLSRLFNAWTDRMDTTLAPPQSASAGGLLKKTVPAAPGSTPPPPAANSVPAATPSRPLTQFLFTYMGRTLDTDETPEDACIEAGDEIYAVEMLDLTGDDMEPDVPAPVRKKLLKDWPKDEGAARKEVEDILDGIARERLKDVLRQYELREKHFECVIRSKELEVLLAKARVEEQRHVLEGERARHAQNESECAELRKQLEETQQSQQRLMDKLVACCREPSSERTTKLFEFLRVELAKRDRSMQGTTGTAPAAIPPVVASAPISASTSSSSAPLSAAAPATPTHALTAAHTAPAHPIATA
ncbi:hypothetical protein BKA62DRAFT_691227 [Auriculariales sp. MPI-PUGE-AT-0066]|nr:hypothetical protein BKA62DRAFT_691227 [Auriculariales sp. MPI-PUGE-AT-0066]